VKTFLQFAMLATVILSSLGCASNYYNVPRETFEKKVKILGVAPIFVDADSDLRHPEKDALVSLVREQNRKNEKELVARLKETGTFFSVRLLDDDSVKLFQDLMFRRERRDDAAVIYNKYFYKLPELKELITRNGLDAVMFTVVSGLTERDTVRSSNLMNYLDADYNFLVMTSQIFDADGNILWEYPNFREKSPALTPLLELQFADFDEAKANETDKVEIKFKTIPGITRAFNKGQDASSGNGKVSSAYVAIFKDMASLLEPENSYPWSKKKETPAEGQQAVPQAPKREPVQAEEMKPAEATQEVTKPEDTKVDAVQPEVIKEEVIKDENIK